MNFFLARNLFPFFCYLIFSRLEKRVERMEKSVGSICTKIDAVLAKLETMEKGKNKRKKLFDTMTSNEEGDE